MAEDAAEPVAEGLSAVASGGDRGATLRALRDYLAFQIETCGAARDVAALTARLLDVLTQLDALPAPTKGTVLDELAERRAKGERVTARPARARRG
jgi:hypothetical protein